MTQTHTPGPWSVSENDATGERSKFYIFIDPGVAVIERKMPGSDACDMLDARLIAAAPQLLQLARDYLEWSKPLIKDIGMQEMARKALAVIILATEEPA